MSVRSRWWIKCGHNNYFLAWRFRECLILDSWYIFLDVLLHKAVIWLDQERLHSMDTPRTLWFSTSLTVWFPMEIGGHFKVKFCLFCLVVISINLVLSGWRDIWLSSAIFNKLLTLSCRDSVRFLRLDLLLWLLCHLQKVHNVLCWIEGSYWCKWKRVMVQEQNLGELHIWELVHRRQIRSHAQFAFYL